MKHRKSPPDATEQDLALVPIMIGAIIHSARHVDPQLWRRALAIVLDGLRPEHTARLPGAGPDNTQLAASSASGEQPKLRPVPHAVASRYARPARQAAVPAGPPWPGMP